MIETIWSEYNVRLWKFLGLTTVLDKSKSLELLHCRPCTVLLSEIERVVLLRHPQTENGIANENPNGNYSSEHRKSSRPLLLVMHSRTGIRQLVVEVLIGVTEGVCSVMWEIILVHVVIMEVHSAIEVLRKEVEPNIVPMCWHEFIKRQLLVSPVNGQREGEVTGFKDGHLTLEIFIFACVIVLVTIANANPRGEDYCMGLAETLCSKSLYQYGFIHLL